MESSYLFSCSGFGMLCELTGVLWRVSGETYVETYLHNVMGNMNGKSLKYITGTVGHEAKKLVTTVLNANILPKGLFSFALIQSLIQH